MNATFLNTIPILPTTDIERDVRWYQEKMGLQLYFADKMYAVLYRDNLCLHLQWHADTPALKVAVTKSWYPSTPPICIFQFNVYIFVARSICLK